MNNGIKTEQKRKYHKVVFPFFVCKERYAGFVILHQFTWDFLSHKDLNNYLCIQIN